jgi:hypothetical protein
VPLERRQMRRLRNLGERQAECRASCVVRHAACVGCVVRLRGR